jgi:hypothetical protein
MFVALYIRSLEIPSDNKSSSSSSIKNEAIGLFGSAIFVSGIGAVFDTTLIGYFGVGFAYFCV